MLNRVIIGTLLVVAPGCSPAPPQARVDLIREPTTLSAAPQVFVPDEPLPADNDSVGVCLLPDAGYNVSGRWTVVTPAGREALVVAHAELASGRVIKLASPSSTGSRLCVHPRHGGPLEAPVERVRVVASTPIVVSRLVWESTAR